MRLPIYLILFAIVWSACGQAVVKRSDTDEYFTEEYTLRKKDGVKHGPYKKYTHDGALVEEGQYQEGEIHGERKKFAQGNLVSVETIEKGRFHGLYQSFYPDGSLNSSGTYENDQMTGVWKRYYRNGQVLEEVNFMDNLENGPFREYYENGKLKAEGNYLNGDQEHGELLLYNNKGQLIRKMNCIEGICKTTWELESSEK